MKAGQPLPKTDVPPLRVIIDASVNPREAGGVSQVVQGLVHGLGRLTDGTERYVVLVETQEQFDWIHPYIGPNTTISRIPGRFQARWLKSFLPKLRPALPLLRWLRTQFRRFRRPRVSGSDGLYESFGDVVHIPHQHYRRSRLPTVYNPHDLQFVHLPKFHAADGARQEVVYGAGCRESAVVGVATEWIRADIVRHYNLAPDKVAVIPWAAPTEAYPKPTPSHNEAVRVQYNLPVRFALYPAVCWPHKNHVRLLEALARLRDEQGVRLSLVCTGSTHNPHFAELEKSLRRLRLTDQVQFLGYVPSPDMRSLLFLSDFLVMPSLFESFSFPIYEAWNEGRAVACSDRGSLPEQVADAGLLFDPFNVAAIAEALHRLERDARLRRRLGDLGRARLAGVGWERTARAYRAVYRRVSGRGLTVREEFLLKENWLRSPSSRAARASAARATHVNLPRALRSPHPNTPS